MRVKTYYSMKVYALYFGDKCMYFKGMQALPLRDCITDSSNVDPSIQNEFLKLRGKFKVEASSEN